MFLKICLEIFDVNNFFLIFIMTEIQDIIIKNIVYDD